MNLTQNPGDDFDPVWSPDGTHIAFASNRENGEEGGQFIYVMLADGSEVVQVSHNNESKYPDWSPLGNQIVYSSQGEIYLVNIFAGTEANLTNSPEWDEQPKFSPDGQRIVWLKGEGNDRQVYVMDLNGGNVTQVTSAGKVDDAEWSVDGRIFTHWEQPEGICFNCLVTADGTDIADAGGKGTIQEFLPFWTNDGHRVELGSGDVNGSGNDDIFLVGENFPDLFYSLTNSPGNDRNPDTAARAAPPTAFTPNTVQSRPPKLPKPLKPLRHPLTIKLPLSNLSLAIPATSALSCKRTSIRPALSSRWNALKAKASPSWPTRVWMPLSMPPIAGM